MNTTTQRFPLSPFLFATTSALALLAMAAPSAQAQTNPLRVLLITGGCCHDYAKQKDILKKGLEERAHVTVDQVHTSDGSTRPPLAILGNPEYAKGYDLVIHDECAADISDEALVKGVLKPHQDGLPGVNLHCAMHSYRIGNPGAPVTPGTPHGFWFEYLGLQSSGHGPQLPIQLSFTDADNAITRGMTNWITTNEELYNNIHVFEKAKPLVRGQQISKGKDGSSKTNESVVAWANEYGAKRTRVFSTTIGHNNVTVEDPRYLDLVSRGVLWATGHLNEDGTPAKGYGPGGK